MSKSPPSRAKGPDPRDEPAYPLSEAARYVKLPLATLSSWIVGRPYPRAGEIVRFDPLIQPARRKPSTLSFWNLVEVHVLRSLRTEHGVRLSDLRKAIRFAERE